MTLPKFKTQEEVPEAFRDAYHEKDGQWVPKEEPAGGGELADLKASVQRLETALGKERDDRKAAEKKASDAAAQLKELEDKKKAEGAGITEEQLKQLRAEIREDLEGEYAEFKTKAEALGQENRSLKLDNQVKTLAGKHGVRAERIDAWWRQFGDRFDLTDDGKPMVKDRPGTDVSKFIEGDLKKELPDFYTGTQASGGGAGGIQRDGRLVPGTDAEDVLKNPTGALTAARAAEAEA